MTAANTQYLFDVIRARRSSRTFSGQPISRDELLHLVEAGIYAPSGSNSQNQRFLIVEDNEEIKRIGALRFVYPYPTPSKSEDERRQIHSGGILARASALILVFADTAKTNPVANGEYYIWQLLDVQNCSAAIQNILLLATSKGIGNCWVSACEDMNYSRLLSGKTWRDVLNGYNIPQNYKIQGIVILGKTERLTERGFPKGERKHGVVWENVERGPIEEYLIVKAQLKEPTDRAFPLLTNIRYRVMRRIIGILLSTVRKLDRAVSRIELRL